jgi:hypothetical protein
LTPPSRKWKMRRLPRLLRRRRARSTATIDLV